MKKQTVELPKSYYNPVFKDDYKEKNKFPAPDDYRDIKTKHSDKEWIIQAAEDHYSSFINGECSYGPDEIGQMVINRLYAEGMQSTDQYRTAYTMAAENEDDRRTLAAISFDIVPAMVKLISIMMGKFDKIIHGMSAMAIDELSLSEKEDIMQDIMIEEYEGEFLRLMEEAIGKKRIDDQNLPFQPRTREDIEMLKSMGCFKLTYEIIMEMLLSGTADRCGYEELERRMTYAAIVDGIAWGKNYIDPVSKKPSIRYADATNMIARMVNEDDPEHRRIIHAAEMVWYTAADLRAAGMEKEEIQSVISKYAGAFGNSQHRWTSDNWNDVNLKSYKVLVLDGDFESYDSEFKELREIDGKKVPFDLPHGSTGPSNKKNEFIRNTYPKRYQYKWIVGTKILIPGSYGYQDTMVYENDTPRSSFICYRFSKRSIVNQCISTLNDLQSVFLKLRVASLKARPKGLKIEIGSISQMQINDKDIDPWQILKIYDVTGNIFYQATMQPNGMFNTTGSVSPIEETVGGMGAILNELLTLLQQHINTLREVTGLNVTQDASSPPTGMLVGTAKIAQEATDNALQYIITGRKTLKKNIFQSLSSMWDLVLLHSKDKKSEYYKAFPGAPVEVVQLNETHRRRKAMIIVDVDMAQEDKLLVLQSADQSLKAAKAGQIGITMKDLVFIHMALRRGHLNWAFAYIGYREDMMQQQRQQAEAEMNKQNAAVSEAADKRKLEAKVTEIREKANADIAVGTALEKEKRETLRMQLDLEEKRATKEASTAAVSSSKEDKK